MAKEKKQSGKSSGAAPAATKSKEGAKADRTAELIKRAEAFLDGKATVAELMGLTMEQVYSLAHVGHNLLQEGNFDDALKVCRALVSINPKDPYLHLLLGSALQQSGKKDDAIKSYTAAIEGDPGLVEAYANRGEIYVEKGEIKRAIADLQKAAELDPKDQNPSTLRARAILAVIIQKAEEQAQAGKKGKK